MEHCIEVQGPYHHGTWGHWWTYSSDHAAAQALPGLRTWQPGHAWRMVTYYAPDDLPVSPQAQITCHARKVSLGGYYTSHSTVRDGASAYTISTHIRSLTRADALADARWLRDELLRTGVWAEAHAERAHMRKMSAR